MVQALLRRLRAHSVVVLIEAGQTETITTKWQDRSKTQDLTPSP